MRLPLQKMMQQPSSNYLAIDVGEKRIGLAIASVVALLPHPLRTLRNDAGSLAAIKQIVDTEEIGTIVVGMPRNHRGEPTRQTHFTESFIAELRYHLDLPIETCDEAMSSIRAKRELNARKKPYAKEAVDALAAAYILEDYLKEKGIVA